ncbi:MAG: TatD family hydrolase [Monoglobales bacterium]
MLFDSHCHVNDDSFDKDRSELIESLPEKGVDLLMEIGFDLESSKKAAALADKYPFIYAAVGFHPNDTRNMTESDITELAELASLPKVKAIGEIGLDYHYPDTHKPSQKMWFRRQMELAMDLNMPFIIHDRDSHADCLEILKDFDIKRVGGVMHCFSGSVEMAKEAIKMGLFISLGGPVTFKNARHSVNVAREIPLDRILIETDSPYLAPDPLRGKRNSPEYVRYVAEKIAEIKSEPFEVVAEVTKQNAMKLFNIL